jgi:hypothetical protein
MISHQCPWTRGLAFFTACALVTTIAANVHAELLRNNLISYWQLNDGPGTTAADTAATLAGGGGSVADDGMLRGSPTWISGIFGAGVQFDGATQDILIPNSADMDIGSNAVTLSAWVKLDQLPSGITGSFGGILDSTVDNYVMYLDKGNNELRFKVTDNAGVTTGAHPGIPASMLNTTDWLHVMGVYDGSQGSVKIYLNGNLVDIGSMSTLVQTVRTGQVASIGAEPAATSPFTPTAGRFFQGAVADVALWKRALGGAEAQYLYNGGAGNSVASANPDIAPLPGLTPMQPSVQPVIYYSLNGDVKNYGTGGSALDATFHDGPDASGPQFATSVVGQGLDLRGNPTGTNSTSSNGDFLSVNYTLPEQGTISMNFQDMDWFSFNSLWSNSVNANAWEAWIYGNANDPPGRLAARANSATNAASLDFLLQLLGPDAESAPHHVAFTWDRNGATSLNKLYVDGVLREQFVENWLAPGSIFYIGGGFGAVSGANHLGKGIYDEVRVYDVPLSDAEILSLSEVPEPGSLVILALAMLIPCLFRSRKG